MYRPRRKRLLTDKFQYRLLAFNLIYFFIVLFISATTLFLPVIIDLKVTPQSALEKQEAADEFLALHARVWPPLLVVFALLAIHSVIVSHRIAGPLNRFRAAMRAVGEGDLSVQIALRRYDYLGTEADVLNAMVASLGSRVRAIQQQYGEVERLFEQVKRAAESASAGELRTSIGSLRAKMEQLRKCLDQFTTLAPEIEGDAHLPARTGGVLAPGRSAWHGPV